MGTCYYGWNKMIFLEKLQHILNDSPLPPFIPNCMPVSLKPGWTSFSVFLTYPCSFTTNP